MIARPLSIALALVTAGAVSSALLRHRQESRMRPTALVVDWNDIQQAFSRDGKPISERLDWLAGHGATAVLLSGVTLGEFVHDGAAVPVGVPAGRDPLAAQRLLVGSAPLAAQLYWEWTLRGVPDIRQPVQTASGWLLERTQGTWEGLRDVDSGFDPRVAQAVKRAGLTAVLRLAQDPWISTRDIPRYLSDHPVLPMADGMLFHTDDPPGGRDAIALWEQWLSKRRLLIPFLEGKPPRIQREMARRLPGLARRAHTISLNELKEMSWPKERARWRRAAVERTCRFLLIRVSAADSPETFAHKLGEIRSDLRAAHQITGWPRPEPLWRMTPGWLLVALNALALGMALVTPALALYAALQCRTPAMRLARLTGLTILGGLGIAALMDRPELRLEVIAFRGVKLAMLGGWLLPLLVLYKPRELGRILGRGLRRWELAAGVLAVSVLAYVMLRSGNAPSGWQAGIEQPIRQWLESWLPARPRFKEFAVGYPLLTIGLWASVRRPMGSWAGWPWTFWAAVGMLGPVSTLNTFCHLHSPVALALWRSAIGILAGSLLGLTLVALTIWRKTQDSR